MASHGTRNRKREKRIRTLYTIMEHAKGRGWITGRDPLTYEGQRHISCVRLATEDLVLIQSALRLAFPAKLR